MKKIIFLLLMVCIVSFAFKPVVFSATDYRSPYVGSYFCNTKRQVQSTPGSGLTYVNDTMTIIVAEDAIDSILDITANQTTYQVKLKNNTINPYPAGSHWGGRFYSTDSVYFMAYPGKGPGSLCSYSGKQN